MALERIGIGGVLTFNQGQFVKGTNEARDSLGRFIKTSNQVPPTMQKMGASVTRAFKQIGSGTKMIGTGIKQMGAGLAQASVGLLPLTAAVGAGVKTAAGFEKQMGAVGAITRANAADMARLTAKAEEMGIKSVFSAQQSGEAMEFMARAGATTDQIMSGLSGVMNAASAEGIDLATSADIVAQSTKIMGRTWDQAANTADILALTSMKTNTNIVALGEALRFGGQSAANMGFSLEETAATMGLLADAGLRGSIGGTSLTNMFNKMLKPSAKAQKIQDQWNIKLTDGQGKMKSMAQIVGMFSKRLNKIRNPAERAALTTELFGIRGQRAFQALAKAGPEAMSALTEEMRKASHGIGAAAEASIKRLDNFSGAFTLFSSSIQAASIKIFKPLLGPMKEALQGFTEGLNNVLLPLGMIRAGFKDVDGKATTTAQLVKDFGGTSVQIAMGINDAIDTMISTWETLVTWVKATSRVLNETFGAGRMRTITKYAVLIGVAAAAAAPLILGLVTIGFAISGLMTLFSGLATVATGVFTIIKGAILLVAGAFWPIVAVAGVLAIAFIALRREGESVGETVTRVWGNIKAGALALWHGVLVPMAQGFMQQWAVMSQFISEVWNQTFGEVVQVIKFAWSEIKATFMELFGAWFQGGGMMKSDWAETGKFIATTLGLVISGAIKVIGFFIKAAALAATTLFKILAWPFKMWDKLVKSVFDHILVFMEGGFTAGIINLGKTLFNVLTWPMRKFLELAAKAAELIPGVEVPQGIKDFLAGGFKQPESMFKPENTARVAAEASQEVAQKQTAPTVATAPQEKGLLDRIQDEVRAITDLKAAEKQKAAETPKVEANINLEDKRTVDIRNNLCVDGEEMSIARERHKQEIQERAGFKSTPWQRRVALQQGAAPRKAIA